MAHGIDSNFNLATVPTVNASDVVVSADVNVANQPLEQCLANFSLQLRQIKSSLEQRDFVSLGDILQYETSDTTQSWLSCIDAVRQLIS